MCSRAAGPFAKASPWGPRPFCLGSSVVFAGEAPACSSKPSEASCSWSPMLTVQVGPRVSLCHRPEGVNPQAAICHPPLLVTPHRSLVHIPNGKFPSNMVLEGKRRKRDVKYGACSLSFWRQSFSQDAGRRNRGFDTAACKRHTLYPPPGVISRSQFADLTQAHMGNRWARLWWELWAPGPTLHVGQGCQTQFLRRPQQPRCCLPRAECNFRTV